MEQYVKPSDVSIDLVVFSVIGKPMLPRIGGLNDTQFNMLMPASQQRISLRTVVTDTYEDAVHLLHRIIFWD